MGVNSLKIKHNSGTLKQKLIVCFNVSYRYPWPMQLRSKDIQTIFPEEDLVYMYLDKVISGASASKCGGSQFSKSLRFRTF